MKAINILWDIDGKDVSLPSEIEEISAAFS